jgi:hypothetical protein
MDVAWHRTAERAPGRRAILMAEAGYADRGLACVAQDNAPWDAPKRHGITEPRNNSLIHTPVRLLYSWCSYHLMPHLC